MLFNTGACHSHSVIKNNELIEHIERFSKLVHFFIVKWPTTSTIISPLLITFVNYFVNGMGDESFHFDGTLWFPFDANEPLGFFVALLLQAVSVLAIANCVSPIISTYVGSCSSIMTFLKDIARDISHLKKRKILNMDKPKLTERFCNFVQFHADVEELSGHSIL